MAAHNAIPKKKYSYLSSISFLNNIRGDKLKLKLFSFIGKKNSVLMCLIITVNGNNRNERKLQKKYWGVPTKVLVSQLLIIR